MARKLLEEAALSWRPTDRHDVSGSIFKMSVKPLNVDVIICEWLPLAGVSKPATLVRIVNDYPFPLKISKLSLNPNLIIFFVGVHH